MRAKVRTGIKIGYSFFLIAILLYGAQIFGDVNIAIWKSLKSLGGPDGWLNFFITILLFFMVYRLNLGLAGLNWRVLEWRLIPFNANFVPLEFPWLRVPFLLVLYFDLPVLAFVEEYIFRDGFGYYPTHTWQDVIWRSIAFGFAHMLGGASVRVCSVLSLTGVWFSLIYLVAGGVLASTSAHFLYNATGLTFMLAWWLVTKEDPFKN